MFMCANTGQKLGHSNTEKIPQLMNISSKVHDDIARSHGRKQDKGRQDNGRSCQHSKCLNKMAALEKKGLKHKWIKRYIKQNNLASSSLSFNFGNI